MQDLLSGLDDSFWNASPTPDPSPAKPKQKTTRIIHEEKRPSTPPKPTGALNLAELLEGAEDWDFSDDFLTPKKEVKKKEIPVCKACPSGICSNAKSSIVEISSTTCPEIIQERSVYTVHRASR